jgi:hypothetical protein
MGTQHAEVMSSPARSVRMSANGLNRVPGRRRHASARGRRISLLASSLVAALAGCGLSAILPAPAAASEIAYVCSSNLCRVDPTTGVVRQLTRDGTSSVDQEYTSPSISRDGTQLAFTHGGNVYMADSSAGGARDIVHGHNVRTVALRPDGGRILAITHSFVTGGNYLNAYAADGSAEQFEHGNPASFGWAGSRVLTDGQPGTLSVCLWIEDAKTCERNVAYDPSRDINGAVETSPDGSLVAAVTSPPGASSGSSSIGLFNAATGALARDLVGGTSLNRPTFSPDGAQIAFQNGSGIDVVNLDGSGQRTLVPSGADPSWGGPPDAGPGTTPGGPGPGRGVTCDRLKGAKLQRCQIARRLKTALARCQKLKGKKGARCIKKATARALAELKCQSIKKPKQRATCLRKARRGRP